MEMCYEGTLVMPSNYVVMNEEEMTYIEGGGTIIINRSTINKAFSSVLSTAGTYGFLLNKSAKQICGYILKATMEIGRFLLSLSGLGGFVLQACAFAFAGVVATSAMVIGTIYATNSSMKLGF